jgi:hypothetical protein
VNGEHTYRVGLVWSGCAVTLLLAPGTPGPVPHATGVSTGHGDQTVVASPCVVDPEDQDREPGQDLARVGERVDVARPGPAHGRPEPVSLPIPASGRRLFMVAPKQGPPAPPLV